MFETVVKVPGTSVYVPVSVPVDNFPAANMEANHLLDVVIPHAVVQIRNADAASVGYGTRYYPRDSRGFSRA